MQYLNNQGGGGGDKNESDYGHSFLGNTGNQAVTGILENAPYLGFTCGKLGLTRQETRKVESKRI